MSSRIRLGALEDCSPLVSVLTFTWAISAPEFPRESFFKVRTSQQSAVFHLSASHEKDKNSTLLFKSGFQLCGHSGCGLNSQHRKGKGKYEKRSEFYPSIARRPVSGISVHGEAQYSSIVQVGRMSPFAFRCCDSIRGTRDAEEKKGFAWLAGYSLP